MFSQFHQSVCDSCASCDHVSLCRHRLFHSCYAGVEDGPGGVGRAGEVESPQRVEDHVGQRRHVDPCGFPLVHLSLHWCLASGGECLVSLTEMFILETCICRNQTVSHFIWLFPNLESVCNFPLSYAPLRTFTRWQKSLFTWGKVQTAVFSLQSASRRRYNTLRQVLWDCTPTYRCSSSKPQP